MPSSVGQLPLPPPSTSTSTASGTYHHICCYLLIFDLLTTPKSGEQESNMNSLLTLAGTTSLLGGGNPNSSLEKQLEERMPGFGILQSFFKTWLRLDLTTVLTIAALMGAVSSGMQTIQSAGSRIYWWVVKFLTASISIGGQDRLNREVINYLGAQVLSKHGARILTAHSETIQSDAYHWRRVHERNDYHHENRVPLVFAPTFGTTWFFHDRNLFMVRRIFSGSNRWTSADSGSAPDEFAGAPDGDEPLVVMCLGRSVQPIKRFLEMCRDFAEKQRQGFVTIRCSKGESWNPSWNATILRPLRALETIHFDEKVKENLVNDITAYLDINTRKFYHSRGIPYRRGYLLHGPPGTGKSSLSQALAGKFGLELYLVHIPSIDSDTNLDRLFTALPPRCIVLLEDIDAVGIKRRMPRLASKDGGSSDTSSDPDENSDTEDDEGDRRGAHCTLSGLLNILDGVSSQEGRIVLMTSNFPEKLDKALIRPGRVDKMIHLGNISQRSAELMFLRMYAVYPEDEGAAPPADEIELVDNEKLHELALEFSSQIPDDYFTPAQLQNCLLSFRDSPVRAVAEIAAWVKEESAVMEDEKEKALKVSERRKQKRRQARIKAREAKAKKEAKKGEAKEADSDTLDSAMTDMMTAPSQKIDQAKEAKEDTVTIQKEDTLTEE